MMLLYRRDLESSKFIVCLAVGLLVSVVGLGAGSCASSSGSYDWRGVPTNDEEKKVLRKGREEAQPDRCRSDNDWKKSRKKGGGGDESVVSGTGGAGAEQPLIISHQLDYNFFCGDEIPGLDGNYHDGDTLEGETNGTKDLRIWFAYALHFDRIDETIAVSDDQKTDELSDLQRAFYRVALRHQCFSQTDYNAAKHYPTYDWCKRRTTPDAMPGRSKVKSLLEERLPDRKFEQKNFMFIYDHGKKMRKKVVEAFEKFESNFPIVRATYVDAPGKGVERYETLRNKHADVYETLEPITRALETGEAPQEGCGRQLETVQNDLADDLDIEPTPDAVHDFRAGHPTGRQVTEALAYCYSQNPHAQTRFSLENELLEHMPNWYYDRNGFQTTQEKERAGRRVPPARITKLQHIVTARQDAFEADKADAELPAFLKDATHVPDLEREWLARPRPKIEYQPETDGSVRQIARGYADDEYELREETPVPVISAITEVPVGYQLEFPMNTRIVRNETCDEWRKTDRVKRIKYVNGEQRVIYEKECLAASVKEGEISDGFEPILVADWEGQFLESGMRAYVRSNPSDPKDSVLVDAWWPDKESPDDTVIIKGVRVNQ